MTAAEWIAFGVAVFIILIGILGTVLPALPGIPLIWLSMLVFALIEGFERVNAAFLGVTLVVAVAAEAADHLVRVWGARRYGAGRAGAWGTFLGAVAGLFFLPLGLIIGPFLGALVGELLAGRSFDEAFRAGWGGLVGTLGSVVTKFVIGVGMLIAFVITIL